MQTIHKKKQAQKVKKIMFNLTVQDLEKYSTAAGIQGLAWSEQAR